MISTTHVLHPRAHNWFASVEKFATCPITEGSLVRFALRTTNNTGWDFGRALLDGFYAMRNHVFWPDDLSYLQIQGKGVYGHKQVTDAYLAALAQAHGGMLATMDEALAATHAEALLIY